MDNSAAVAVDRSAIRALFPTLGRSTVLLENAGGSQVPACVANAVREHMLGDYVQLGAGYPASDRATAMVDAAHDWAERFMNAEGIGRAIIGPSCTQLVTMLADAHARSLEPGDEIVVAMNGHEANVGPWMKLADRGLVVREWPIDPATGTCRLEDLDALLTPRTRLVACVHVSNLLGGIDDVRAIADRVHANGPRTRLCVDGVAFAPHRAIDVQAFGADWYVYSTYKVYGPHMAVLFGTHEALDELAHPNHFFIPKGEIPYGFELGGPSHEGCAGLLALRDHLCALAALDGTGAPVPAPAAIDRRTVVRAMDLMRDLELDLQRPLVDHLAAHPRVARVVGPAHGEASRVPTVSFVHESRPSRDVAADLIARGFALRHGHMYSHRLCTALGIPVDDGVVRISAVHYNTPEEIEALNAALDEVL